MPALNVYPSTIRAASAFVGSFHRHHKPPQGALFALSVTDDAGNVRGVAIVGRPVARGLNDGTTAEVTRLCTLGDKNACSMLYAAAWRAARALGYRRMVTYILAEEPGTSLKAAGWVRVTEVTGRSWSCASRPRVDKHPTTDKTRWEVAA